MAKDLTVYLENKPGALASVGETLGRAGINIAGGCAFLSEGRGVVHMLIEDAAAARRVLQQAGFEVGEERDVITMPDRKEPGTLGQNARRVADAGANIELFYATPDGRLVVGVDDIERVRRAMT